MREGGNKDKQKLLWDGENLSSLYKDRERKRKMRIRK